MRTLLAIAVLAIAAGAFLIFSDPGHKVLMAFGMNVPECTEARLLVAVGINVPSARSEQFCTAIARRGAHADIAIETCKGLVRKLGDLDDLFCSTFGPWIRI